MSVVKLVQGQQGIHIWDNNSIALSHILTHITILCLSSTSLHTYIAIPCLFLSFLTLQVQISFVVWVQDAPGSNCSQFNFYCIRVYDKSDFIYYRLQMRLRGERGYRVFTGRIWRYCHCVSSWRGRCRGFQLVVCGSCSLAKQQSGVDRLTPYPWTFCLSDLDEEPQISDGRTTEAEGGSGLEGEGNALEGSHCVGRRGIIIESGILDTMKAALRLSPSLKVKSPVFGNNSPARVQFLCQLTRHPGFKYRIALVQSIYRKSIGCGSCDVSRKNLRWGTGLTQGLSTH